MSRTARLAASLSRLPVATATLALGCALAASPATQPPSSHAPAGSKPGTVLAFKVRESVPLPRVGSMTAGLYARVTAPAARYGVDRWRVQIQSTDERGRPIRVAALLYAPKLPAAQGAAALPLYVMGPGTTGLADACAPTREQAHVDNWGDYEAHMLSYAAQGYVAIMPDWANFDDPQKLQPYFVAASEGRIMLDAARAARAFLGSRSAGARASNDVFLAGFSQGGHAAFAAADRASRYAPELNIRGVIGYAPAMDVATLLRERPALGPYLLRSYTEYYGVKPEVALQDRWVKAAHAEAGKLCISDAYRTFPNDAASMYRPEFWRALQDGQVEKLDAALARVLKRNAPGFHATGRAVPALVVTGLTDPIVTARAQEDFVLRSCEFGRKVVQRAYDGANHFQARQFGFTDTLAWMRDVQSGKVADGCGAVRFASGGRGG